MSIVRSSPAPQGWWFEWRNGKPYGFCDKGCKPIVRKFKWQVERAMNEHLNEHNGQQRLIVDKPQEIDDGPLPF